MNEDLQQTPRSFLLRPFVQGALVDNLSIDGSLTRTPDSLLVEYNIHGMLKNIKHPILRRDSRRDHELWRHTCFELFFGLKGDPGYWEANFCLSGRWNVYRFDDYRTGMREDKAMKQPVCRVATGSNDMTLYCRLSLNGLIDKASELEAAVSSVIETSDGQIHFWALEHQNPKPDFHKRSSFLLELPALS